MPKPNGVPDAASEVSDLTKSEVSDRIAYAPQELREDRPLRFFVSYAHLDKELQHDLVHRLQLRLKNHKNLRFKHWTDRDIEVGADWFESIKHAMQECDFAILLVSPAFLSRDFIREHELPWLYSNRAVIPVALRPLTKSLDLRGLETKQIFFNDGKSYIDHRDARAKDQFADAFFEALCTRLESHTPPVAPTSLTASQRKYSDHFRRSVSDYDAEHFAPTEGVESTFHKGLEPGPAIDSKLRKDALTFLTSWVTGKDEPPYCALLGETGLGKTTTCKAFASQLLDKRESNATIPLPIYFDLRHIGGRGNGLVLDEIIDLILKESWKGGPAQTRLKSADIFHLVETQPTLVIWDGLDEVLVHLTDNEGQRFTRQLFRILPPAAKKGERRPGRMLVTCRTHYFRTLRDQQTHFRGEDRDNIREDDYRAPFLLLPFTPDQVKAYLKATLPHRDPNDVMQVISSVHNLTEMSERPYTLSLIAKEIETVERWKAEGRKVTGVTLYRHLVTSWLERDTGKHQIEPDHKQRIMEHLAAALWQSGQRFWKVADLEEWLLDFFDGHPEIKRHYPDKGIQQLKEDLRTATFLVREGDDQFRFAHTSLQEFFLAGYLRRALEENQPERWAMKRVSRETLDFLGQWMEERDENTSVAVATLGRIRDAYRENASQQALAYCLHAHNHNYPHPSLEGFQLGGADLTQWDFIGTGISPLRLNRINLAGARLWNSRWHHCHVSNADLHDADATGAEFLGCRMDRSHWHGGILEATTFRDSDLRHVTLDEVQNRKSRWLRCDLTDTKLPAGALVAPDRPGEPLNIAAKYEVRVANGHAHFVQACAWSPDGRRIASASSDNTLRIWDAESGESLRMLSHHEDAVTGCAWSPDGRRIASASWDHTLRIWDAESGASLRTLSGHENAVTGCAWSPDGRRIASGSSDNTLRIWEAESGESLRTLSGHENAVNGCAWSPNGRRIASGSSDNTLRIWDAESGESLRTLSGHESSVDGCAWSPDGRRIASASWDHTLRIWDAESGASLRTLSGHESSVSGCAWSPDGRRIASASVDSTLRIWDAESGASLRTLSGHENLVNGCAWSPDGRRIASASWDKTLRIWEAESGESLHTLSGHENAVTGCAWSPDGRRIASAPFNGTLQIWDVESGKSLRMLSGHEGYVTGCAWSPDGRRIASASNDNTLRIWAAESGESLRTLSGHQGYVTGCAWSRDGRRIASASADKTLRVWDAESGEWLRTLSGHERSVNGCAWSPDGRRIASASFDRTLRIWDAESGKSLRMLSYEGYVTGCEWSPDGRRIASASSDKTLRVWDAESGECLRTLSGHESSVTSCSWSPDGRRIASASYDNTLRVWDAESGKCLRTLSGHESSVTGCSWSPDGRMIVSGSADGTLRLWDAETGRELDRRIYLRRTQDGSTWATIDHRHNRILACDSEAWRILGWRTTGPDGFPLILPAETFGSLPICE